MREFNVVQETESIENYDFPANSNQENVAQRIRATRILFWNHDSRGRLPKYALTAIADAGYTVEKIGCTTYRSNTFGLIPKI